ncbi:MAG TPA: thiamine-phosphate kinase [Thermosynechococcaceae cyanobacterium]
MAEPLQVGEIGEQQLLKRLQAFCPAEVVGDDGAVLTVQPGRSLVVTSDVLVDGVHFSDRTTAPEDAGWRAAAANLSDLAAMGATPLGITVGLAIPGQTTVAWVERLYTGLVECLQTYSTVVVGGDICRSPVVSLAITAFGEVDPDRVIRRATAQPGDAIVVTGSHGGSRAGLELLLHSEAEQDLSAVDRAALIRAHQRPQPRLDVLPLLPLHAPISGMDSSDGLADAIVQICRASGVGAKIDRAQVRIPSALAQWLPKKALEWALYGGEDFELVLCLERSAAETLVQQLSGAAIVGYITAEPQVWLEDDPPTELKLEQGFQHFG